MKIKELEKLVLEALINEIGPSMAAKAVKPALMKRDPRTATILRDAVISMFSKYIGKKLPFNFIARTEGHPVEYELIEVVSKISFNDPRVEFHFYNPEGVEDDKPFALNKKNIVVIYDIKEDELKDSKSGTFHWILNPFTSKFFANAANDIRKMYYTAMPETILQPKEDMPWEKEFVPNPNFKMKSKINKNDFKEFSYDSKSLSLNEGTDTGNPYDLNNPSNLDDFYRKIVDVWTFYCGGRPNDWGVANDNRVILYNLLESGELANRINMMWSPATLNVGQSGSDYYTNNPEDMKAHLNKMGETDYTLTPGHSIQKDEERLKRFQQPYANPETSTNLNEVRSIIREALLEEVLSEEALDEGLRDWIIKGLIAITLIGGGIKMYHMDQQAAKEREQRMEYYENHLADKVQTTSKEDLCGLGLKINEKTKDMSLSRHHSREDAEIIFSQYAKKYMKQHPEQFGFGIDGNIYWITPQ